MIVTPITGVRYGVPGVSLEYDGALSSLYLYIWPVSQMQVPLTACREIALDYNTLPKLLYVFEHKTWYVLIHAPYTRIVVFWHISNIPPMIS